MHNLRFTLFQCREKGDPMRDQEIDCFVSALQIQASQIKAINLPEAPLKPDLFDSTDVFLVGGAGDFSVLDSYRFLSHFFSFLEQVCQRPCPMFASCFGFQALCVALGGSVIYSPEDAEVGTYEVYLSEQGQQDPIFSSLPNSFY
ncbi:type 1 glutamine amidotransferase, partial [bacterium]|nr:type 1 glutamine amidotransferase [bacterium]